MDVPELIPALELKGPRAARLETLDAAIERLQGLRRGLVGEPGPGAPSYELRGPHINAPAWPWFTAGWVLGALMVLLFVAAWSYS